MGVDPDGEQELERRPAYASLKDLVHYEATFVGKVLDLTAREFDFLAYLAKNARCTPTGCGGRWATRAAISCKATPPWATG